MHGTVITRINRAALLFKLGSYNESYLNAKEAISILEPRINNLMRNTVETDLV